MSEVNATILIVEQKQLLQQRTGEPPRLVDPDTNREYVLLPAEIYLQLQAFLGEINPRETYPLLQRALREEGWDEPHTDEYNRESIDVSKAVLALPWRGYRVIVGRGAE